MDHPPQPDDEKKFYCKCSHCGGQFVIPGQSLGLTLLCPHCREEIVEPDITEACVPTPPEDSSLPAPRRGKFSSTEQFKTRRHDPEKQEHLKFDDKIQKFEERPPEEETERVRIKSRTGEQEDDGVVTFFLLLISLGFLSVAGVLYYKTVQFPDAATVTVTAESLLVDNENKNSQVIDFTIEEEDMLKSKAKEDEASPQDTVIDFLKQDVVSKDDLESALTALKNYHKSRGQEEKLKYVFAPEETAEPMKQLLSRSFNNDSEQAKPVQIIDARIVNDILIAHIAYNNSSMRSVNFLRDRQTGKWVLDWFSYQGYQNTNYDDLVKERPRKPIEARVILGMGANYEPPFESEEKDANYKGKAYINVELTFQDGKTLQGYIDRHTDLAVDLMQKLMGGSIPTTIMISFPPADSHAKPDQVIVEQLLRTSWSGKTAQDIYDQASKKAGQTD